MKKIVGFSTFNNTENVEFANIHYTDDDVFPDFVGVTTGSICVAVDAIEFENGTETVNIDDCIEIVPKISRKGKLYKTIKIY